MAALGRPKIGARLCPPRGTRRGVAFSASRLLLLVIPLLSSLLTRCAQAFGPQSCVIRCNGGSGAVVRSRDVVRGLGKLDDEGEYGCSSTDASRRAILLNVGASATAATAVLGSLRPTAAAAAALEDDNAYPPITQKVYLDVRISRSDGTFYVRDDLPDTPENRVFTGRLTLGLFGTTAPRHVEQFLRYIEVPYNPADDSPLPSYAKSRFTRLDQSTGLLIGGVIPGLELTEIGGGTNMRYGGRVLPAPLWIEPRRGGTVEASPSGDTTSQTKKVSHSLGSGLITHRTLDALPNFGVTTRPSPELDNTHVVFGRVLSDESSREFLRTCVDLPTYSMDRPSTPVEAPRTAGERATEEAASRVFAVQREFFRGAAKTFGDSRLDKVYEGKLLRRVEVTKVGIL